MSQTGPERPLGDDVTVVVVTWQRRELVLRCLDSLRDQTVACDVVVVDNASTDGTVSAVREQYPRTRLLELPENVGFAGGVAAALGVVSTRFVALLNNDAVAEPDWLTRSLVAMQDWRVAAVTARMVLAGHSAAPVGPDETINNTGVVLLRTGYGADRGLGDPNDARFDEPMEVFGFSGGAVVLRTLAVQAVGGVPADWFMYYEDTDLSWRLRLSGWRIVYEPGAVVHHLLAASSDTRSSSFAFHNERNRLLMLWRNAPAAFAGAATARFVLTSASLAVRRLRGAEVPQQPVFDTGLRVRVLADLVARFPATLRDRGRVVRTQRRGAVTRAWAGVPARPLDRAA